MATHYKHSRVLLAAAIVLAATLLARGPASAPQASAACADTVIVRAVKRYTLESGTQVSFVEPCTLTAVPGRRFLIEVLRPGGTNPLTWAKVAYGTAEYFGTDDVDATNVLLSRVVTPQGAATLTVTLNGSADAMLDLRITQVPEPLYSVYSSGGLVGAATEKWYTKYFTPAAGVPPAPHVLTLTNGNLDLTGAARATSPEVWLNSQQIVFPGEVTPGRAFVTRNVTLEAANTLQVKLQAGQANKKVSLKIAGTDASAPDLLVTSPPESLVTSAPKVLRAAQVTDTETAARLRLDGASKPLTGGAWSDSLALPAPDGRTTFTFVAENDACLTDTESRTVIRDTHAPTLEVLEPSPNYADVASSSTHVQFRIRVADTTRTTVYLDGESIGVLPMGTGEDTLTVQVPLDLGPNGVHLRAIDALGHVTEFKHYVNRLPTGGSGTDSTTFQNAVPPLTYTEDTGFRSRVSFLYSGAVPVQSGLAEASLVAGREAVVRGRVISRDFGPLGGVTVRVLNHAEFGESVTRNDGAFDLVVNGGAALVLRFQRAGYLEAQRQVEVPVQDFVTVDDVALIGRSARSHHVGGTAEQIVEGRFENDANGDRRIWLVFPPGDTATITPPVGEPLALTEFNVRLKEFTVGGDGLEAMPAMLPPASAYTYCIELGLVEADDIADALATSMPHAPAPEVTFSAPIVAYVRDFLGLPVGAGLPSGHYDPRTGKWIADENGRIVMVLALADTLAVLDTDGGGVADTQADYDTAGIDVAERRRMAVLFAPGDVVWRMRIEHFSLHDLTPTLLATDFNLNSSSEAGKTGRSGAPPPPAPQLEQDPTVSCGCVIESENRVLGETLPLRGTPHALHYRSSRQPGDRALRWIHVPLIGDSLPTLLRRVHLRVAVAGRQFKHTFGGPGEPALAVGMVHVFRDWDGTDAYGRRVTGSVTATVKVGWDFQQRYSLAVAGERGGLGDGSRISGSGSVGTGGDRDVGTISWSTHRVSLGAPSMASAGLGGWTITPHHFFDVNGNGTLYLGDGSVRYNALLPVIKRYAGSGSPSTSPGPSGGDSAASAMGFGITPSGIAVGPDGSVYFTDPGIHLVGRIWPNGGYRRILGGVGKPDYSTDGVLASSVRVRDPEGIAVGPDGTIYFASKFLDRVFKVTPDGRLYCVAGSGVVGAPAIDGVPATQSGLNDPKSVALGPDGSLFIAEYHHRRIRRVGLDGIIRTYAGNGQTPGTGPLEGVATQTAIGQVSRLAVDSQGNLFFTDFVYPNDLLRMVSPDGQLHNLTATDHKPFTLAAGTDGALYIGQWGTYAGVIRRDPDGALSTVAGTIKNTEPNLPLAMDFQEGIVARAAIFPSYLDGLAQGADGRIFVGQNGAGGGVDGIRVIAPPTPRTSGSEIEYPAEGGREAYIFTTGGRHLRTVDVVTGVVLYRFEYDGGRLVRIIDANRDTTSIERSGGLPTVIIGPYGQRTALALDGDGYLSEVRNPLNGEAHSMTYHADGLLATVLDPEQHEQRFTYMLGGSDLDDGRLYTDRDGAGHTQTFTQADNGRTRTVTKQTAMIRTTQYEVTQMLDGLRRRMVRQPDGTVDRRETDIQSSVSPFGEIVREVGPAGDTTTTRHDRDPRFGMLAPLSGSVVTRLPSGLTRTVTRGRAVGTGTTTETLTEAGRAWTSTYDSTLRRLTTTSPASRRTIAWFDPQGRMTAVGADGLAALRLTYDVSGRGRLTDLVQGSRAWHYDYDPQGRLWTLRNAFGHTLRYERDAADRDTSHVLPGGRTVGYRYFADGRLENLHPPGRPLHEFAYTEVGQNRTYTPPAVDGVANPATGYLYSPDRQLTDVNRPDGGNVHFDYGGANGRLETITHPRGVHQFTYWDTPQPPATQASGQLKSVTSPDGVTCAYEYDGPLLTRESWSGAVTGSVARTYDRSFRDSTDRVTVGSASCEVRYHYDDPDGLLTRVTESPAAGWTFDVTRAAATGFVAGTAVGSGAGRVTSSAAYDSLGQLENLSYQRAGSALFEQAIERNALGQVTRVDERWYGGAAKVLAYGYDLAGRLDSVAVDGVVIRRYEYDGNGNRTVEKDGSGATLASGGYDSQDRMLTYGTAAYAYTANGELAKRIVAGTDTTRYTYDALGNLTGAHLPGTSGDSLVYVIDGQNRRVAVTRNGTPERQWLYAGAIAPIAELDGTGALLHRYVYATLGHAPDLVVDGGSAMVYRVITDQLGSVRAVVRTTDGAIVQRTDYDAWGVVVADTNGAFQSLGYAGGLTDRTTALVRFGARDYDAGVGRWTAKDRSGLGAGTNLYQYCLDTPLLYVDPVGAEPTKPGPPPLPAPAPGMDIDANICEALEHQGDWWWLWEHSHPGSEWDYRGKYGNAEQSAGNANWGAIASAWGLDEEAALRIAGAGQRKFSFEGTFPGAVGLPFPPYLFPPPYVLPPYGDQPGDHYAIRQGQAYYAWFAKNKNCRCPEEGGK